MYFVVRAIHEFKIAMKFLFTLIILRISWNPHIQMSTNMSNVVNDFTVTYFSLLPVTLFSTLKFLWKVPYIHNYILPSTCLEWGVGRSSHSCLSAGVLEWPWLLWFQWQTAGPHCVWCTPWVHAAVRKRGVCEVHKDGYMFITVVYTKGIKHSILMFFLVLLFISVTRYYVQ